MILLDKPKPCDRCGRRLTHGVYLFAASVPHGDALLGLYGRDCAQAVVRARAEQNVETWDHMGKLQVVR